MTKDNAVITSFEKKENAESIKKTVNLFEKSKRKKVAICGTAPSIKDAPFKDESFDIWGVAHCCFLPDVTRMDEIFEIHKEYIWRNDKAPFHRFPNAKIYLQEAVADLPNSVKYPLDEVLKEFRVNKGFENESDYFSSSIPYMIAMAIMKGYEEIHMYGIHLLMEEEYFYQRPATEYYLGIAVGKGIKVYMSPAADILKFGYLYGFNEKENQQFIAMHKDRLDEFDKRLAALQNNAQTMAGQYDAARQQLAAQINQLIGARENEIYLLRQQGKEMKTGNYIKY